MMRHESPAFPHRHSYLARGMTSSANSRMLFRASSCGMPPNEMEDAGNCGQPQPVSIGADDVGAALRVAGNEGARRRVRESTWVGTVRRGAADGLGSFRKDPERRTVARPHGAKVPAVQRDDNICVEALR